MHPRLLAALVLAVGLPLTACSTLAGPVTDEPPRAQGLRTAASAGTRLAPTRKGPLTGRVVVVDAGHAGVRDPDRHGRTAPIYGGARVPCYTAGTAAPDGTREHTLNHDLALRTADELRSRGATVVLTRADDTKAAPCNAERARIANRVHADLLVSVHGDGDAAYKRGFHVIHSPTMRGGARLQDRSRTAAATIARALKRTPLPPANYKGTPDRPIDARTNLGVLNELTRTPGVLVEVGNLANPDDWGLLAAERTRDAVAAALARGVEDALSRT